MSSRRDGAVALGAEEVLEQDLEAEGQACDVVLGLERRRGGRCRVHGRRRAVVARASKLLSDMTSTLPARGSRVRRATRGSADRTGRSPTARPCASSRPRAVRSPSRCLAPAVLTAADAAARGVPVTADVQVATTGSTSSAIDWGAPGGRGTRHHIPHDAVHDSAVMPARVSNAARSSPSTRAGNSEPAQVRTLTITAPAVAAPDAAVRS